MTEEEFLRDLYDEYNCGNSEERRVSYFIDYKVRWRKPGSTTKAKYLIASVLRENWYQYGSKSGEVKPDTELYSVFESCFNRITNFQKTEYIKGNGRDGREGEFI